MVGKLKHSLLIFHTGQKAQRHSTPGKVWFNCFSFFKPPSFCQQQRWWCWWWAAKPLAMLIKWQIITGIWVALVYCQLSTYTCLLCVCVCLHMCPWMCYRWPPSRWENAGSLLVCVHMYQTQHVFPFQRRGILYACVCLCVCLYASVRATDRTGRLTSRNPAAKTGTVCFLLSHTIITGHTHTYTDHCPILFFPLQVSSTPILVPPAVKMFRCDCHETCSLGAKQRTQIGEEWLHPHSYSAFSSHIRLLALSGPHCLCSYFSLSCVQFRSDIFLQSLHYFLCCVSFAFPVMSFSSPSYSTHGKLGDCIHSSGLSFCHTTITNFNVFYLYFCD